MRTLPRRFGWFPLDALPDDLVRAAIERWRAGAPYDESGWNGERA